MEKMNMSDAIEALRDFVRLGMHVGTPVNRDTIRDALAAYDRLRTENERLRSALDRAAERDNELRASDGRIAD